MKYENRTYEDLIKEKTRLSDTYDELFNKCAKEGLPFDKFKEEAAPIRQKLYFIDKYLRLKMSPTLSYGKEWKGEIFTIEEFIEMSEDGSLIDYDGVGYYATDEAKSDVEAYPSDFIENLYRKDFTHIIWFNK